MDCITDYNVVIADTDIEFVDSLRKMSDETFRKKIASNARKTFEEKYSLEAYISAFNDSFKTMNEDTDGDGLNDFEEINILILN